MSAGQSSGAPELVTVIIDGREFQAEAGRNMLDVALSLTSGSPGTLPHFSATISRR